MVCAGSAYVCACRRVNGVSRGKPQSHRACKGKGNLSGLAEAWHFKGTLAGGTGRYPRPQVWLGAWWLHLPPLWGRAGHWQGFECTCCVSGLFPSPRHLAAWGQISSHALVKTGRGNCCKSNSPHCAWKSLPELHHDHVSPDSKSDCDPRAEADLTPHHWPCPALLVRPVMWRWPASGTDLAVTHGTPVGCPHGEPSLPQWAWLTLVAHLLLPLRRKPNVWAKQEHISLQRDPIDRQLKYQISKRPAMSSKLSTLPSVIVFSAQTVLFPDFPLLYLPVVRGHLVALKILGVQNSIFLFLTCFLERTVLFAYEMFPKHKT